MSDLEQSIKSFIDAVAPDVVGLQTKQGNLASLTTAAKTSLVAAINELKAALESIVSSGAGIDDNAGAGNTTATWSANKIILSINAAIADLVGGAPEALDTLKELSDALQNNGDALSALMTALGNKVDFANAQALSTEQQLRACQNIGVGNPAADFAGYYTAAKEAAP
jgi:hypothetical protein